MALMQSADNGRGGLSGGSWAQWASELEVRFGNVQSVVRFVNMGGRARAETAM